jgi:RNA polymerase sigma-70 factor (ECF subfamily)
MNAFALASGRTTERGVVADAPATHRRAGEPSDVALAAQGDVQAFERLYRANVHEVYRLARRIVGADDADDATQEIFIRLWVKVRLYREESSFRTWLHRLAVNVLIRRGQQRQARGQRFVQADVSLHQGRADAADARLDIERALSTLSPELRAVAVLHDMEGYSHDEIAQLLNISVSAARMRLHRARQALRVFARGMDR